MDSLIGMSSATDPLSQPLRRRSTSNQPPTPSSVHPPPFSRHPIGFGSGGGGGGGGLPIPGVPIPRPSSRIYRPTNHAPSGSSTPLSHSPASPASPYISPLTSPSAPATHPHANGGASATSAGTALTTPASSASLHATPPVPYAAPLGPGGARILSYPSVPPPSLSSSFGSPSAAYHVPAGPPADARASWRNGIPRVPLPPPTGGAGAGAGGAYGGDTRRVAESGSLANRSQSRGSVSRERGARVAETGSLIGRRQSLGGPERMPMTLEDPSPLQRQGDNGAPPVLF